MVDAAFILFWNVASSGPRQGLQLRIRQTEKRKQLLSTWRFLYALTWIEKKSMFGSRKLFVSVASTRLLFTTPAATCNIIYVVISTHKNITFLRRYVDIYKTSAFHTRAAHSVPQIRMNRLPKRKQEKFIPV